MLCKPNCSDTHLLLQKKRGEPLSDRIVARAGGGGLGSGLGDGGGGDGGAGGELRQGRGQGAPGHCTPSHGDQEESRQ